MYGTSFGNGPVPLGNIAASAIFNGQSGDWLVVWDVQVFANGAFSADGAVIDFAIMTGVLDFYVDFQFEPAWPLASGSPAIRSQGWGFNDSANEAGKIFASLQLPVSGYQWPHDWPFCAIAPGDSVVVYSDANQYHTFGAAWMFEVVPGGI